MKKIGSQKGRPESFQGSGGRPGGCLTSTNVQGERTGDPPVPRDGARSVAGDAGMKGNGNAVGNVGG